MQWDFPVSNGRCIVNVFFAEVWRGTVNPGVRIFDVAIDVRKNSKYYGKWVGEILSEENRKQLWIPEGFAHGFLTLSENAEVLYKTNNFYNKESEVSINAFDKYLDIHWPIIKQKVIMSEKDLLSINFKELFE